MVFHIILFLALVANNARCAPLPQQEIPPPDMFDFMKQYGYIEAGPNNTEAVYEEEGFRDAVRVMQKFGGIPETGVVDNDTLNLLRAPRCGVPDVFRKPSDNSTHKRQKRYVIGAKGWKKKTVTYFLANWPPELDSETTARKLKKAFQTWSEITPLKFVPKSNMDADIIVAFGRGPHGDGYPFDGPGSILAHAFFPYEHGSFGGDVHFDDAEDWFDGSVDEKGGDNKVDFFTVATHEIGHSLGLAHSTVSGSIMFPYYKGYSAYMRLDYDDLYAMYDLYVVNGEFEDDLTSSKETDVPTSDDKDDYPSVDDDSHREDDRRRKEDDDDRRRKEGDNDDDDRRRKEDDKDDDYDRKRDDNHDDEDVHRSPTSDDVPDEDDDESDEGGGRDRFTPDNEDSGRKFPTPRNRPTAVPTPEFPKIPGFSPPNICDGSFDSASVIRGELFVFKGEYMWRLKTIGDVMTGYPAKFQRFFRGLPASVKSIDAVYERPTDYNIVFFSGNQYWVHDGNVFSQDGPKPLTDLGLPSNVDHLDAAIVWKKNQKTYLFSGDLYWRFDEIEKQVERGYPQRIGRWKGLRGNLDAAFTWTDGQTYFFRENDFWRFNNQNVSVEPNFPQSASGYWFNCIF